MKSARILIILILLICIMTTGYTQTSATKEEWPAYLFTFFIGFGTGHFYLGDSNAPSFLLGDLISIGIELGGTFYLIHQLSTIDPYSTGSIEGMNTFTVGLALILGGGLLHLGLRIWEIVDLFSAVERARDKGVIASVQPYIDIQPTKTALGFSLKF